MRTAFKILLPLIFSATLFSGCSKKIKQQEDEIYSRHLQEHIKLTVISTPVPEDKKELNLLLLNDGQDVDKLRVKEIVDSLFTKKQIKPLVIVAIHATKKIEQYGIVGYTGNKADKYAMFIDDELYNFVKKKAGVRKFQSVVIAGCTLGGLSAFDFAWDHADKIDKVGVFSGTFGLNIKPSHHPEYSDSTDRMIITKIKSSRKRPKLKYWFYGDDTNENGIRYMDSIVINHTKDLIELIKRKNICSPDDIMYKTSSDGKQDYTSWSNQLPAFLIWSFGK